MNNNLLTNILFFSAVSGVLSGCGESDGNQELYADNLSPVVVTENHIDIVINEDSQALEFDLLAGVENPEDTQMYPREFTFHEQALDADGLPVTDDQGNPTLLYQGPALPVKTVLSSTNFMLVVPQLLQDSLFHPHTVAQNTSDEPMYSQGVYKFSYVIDNGATETVARDITLTVNAVENIAESINFLTAEGFEVPHRYGIQLLAEVMPVNTTFNKLVYSSSDNDIVTVSETGMVTGVNLGDFTITVTSEKGNVANTLSGTVVTLQNPVGVEVIDDDSLSLENRSVVSGTTAYAGRPLDLDYQLLPAEVDWSDRAVTWTTSDESVLTVDENGVVTVASYQDVDRTLETYDPAIHQATVTASVTADPDKSFTTQVSLDVANLLFNGNPKFDKPWDGIAIKAREEADQLNQATFEIREDENSIDGSSLWADTSAGDLRLRFDSAGLIHHSGDNTKDYLLSFDVHLISGGFQSFLNAQGSDWLPWPTDWSKRNFDESGDNTFKAEHVYPASKIITNGTMYFNLHVSAGAVVYLDNFMLEAIEPDVTESEENK